MLLACGLLSGGCLQDGRARAAREAARLYPPAPQVPHVAAIGTLHGGGAPSPRQVQLAMFLFGTEPPAPLTIANPIAVAARENEVLICDNALSVVYRWDASTQQLSTEPFSPPVEHAVAVALAANGDRLVCEPTAVRRTDPGGRQLWSYAGDAETLRPAGVLEVDGEVWVANVATHALEVLDAGSGQHRRTIGRRGREPGEFAFPRGLARLADGSVGVVDMLNNRVQVLDRQGNWLRNIGQAGDTVGSFGRPKDIAAGPDGTVFVTDAFLQRVHAFAPDGQPLLGFGEPGSGMGALNMPSGIAVTRVPPQPGEPLPDLRPAAATNGASGDDRTPSYYVLVAEQLDRPGIRIYAWLGAAQPEPVAAVPAADATRWVPTFPGSVAINPHWDPTRCTTCHQAAGGRMLPIPPADIDPLCLSCHDNVRAPADPHPIGRPAVTDAIQTPPDWPAYEGEIGCLTCHDIIRHCDVNARRPAVNSVLLRGFDPQRALEYCAICHTAERGGRFSPHRQRDASGKIREDACFFCHTQRPEVPADGRRRFEPHLRDETSALCLNCHTKHWDLSPLGHVDRPVSPRIRQWMLMRELSLKVDAHPRQLAELAEEPQRQPAVLPLGGDLVTCYTCHNPHYMGLFPPNSELGALASNPVDRTAGLRTDWIDLCSDCHNR